MSDVILQDCLIDSLYGISSSDGIPTWMQDCEIGEYTSLDNVARIRQTALTPAQKTFVTVARKTFFQPGSARKEEALLRGLGEHASKKIQNQVLSILTTNGILKKAKGDTGTIYAPIRSETSRMRQILSDLQFSEDEIWKKISVIT